MNSRNKESLSRFVNWCVNIVLILLGVFGLFQTFEGVYYCDYSFKSLYDYGVNNYTLNYDELGYFLNKSGYGMNMTIVNVTNCRVII